MKKLLLIFLALPLISFGQVPGCTDSLACNYDVLATIDDGSVDTNTEVTSTPEAFVKPTFFEQEYEII